MTLFLKASSLYSIFTQVPKTSHSTIALQAGFFRCLGLIFRWTVLLTANVPEMLFEVVIAIASNYMNE